MRTYWLFHKFILPRYKYPNTDQKKIWGNVPWYRIASQILFLMMFVWQSPIYLFLWFWIHSPTKCEIELSPNFNKACIGKWSEINPKRDWKTIFWCFKKCNIQWNSINQRLVSKEMSFSFFESHKTQTHTNIKIHPGEYLRRAKL